MILACDIGTSAVKMGVIDRTGKPVWYCREPVGFPSAEEWKRLFFRTCTTITSDLRKAIEAVSVSGNGPTLIPLDADDDPVRPPLLWNEPGAIAPLPFPSKSYFLPRILWYRTRFPALFERTVAFSAVGEYIAFLLTGNKNTVIPHAAYARYYWLDEELTALGLPRREFPHFHYTGSETGKLTARAARLAGLKEGIPVFSGGADFLMALVGTGTLSPGLANDRGGTSEAVNYCSRFPLETAFIRTVPAYTENLFNISGFVHGAGRMLARLKDKLIGRHGTFEAFNRLADGGAPFSSKVRFLPDRFLETERRSRDEITGCFDGVTEDTSPADLARSLLEYLACAVRFVLGELSSGGMEISELRASGGLAKSVPLCRIKAAVTGKTVLVSRIPDAELTGNAIVALAGIGEYGSVQEAAEALVGFESEFEPHPELSRFYEERYNDYLRYPGFRFGGTEEKFRDENDR